MRIAAIGLCFLPLLVGLPAHSAAQNRGSAESIRQSYRAQLNDNTVTIMADMSNAMIAHDIAAVLNDGANLRVVPMIGKGPAQTVKDVMYMRGVDMGITHATVLNHYARTGELGPIRNQIAYVAKLFNEEMHLLAREWIDDVKQLEGKTVNMGVEGSGIEITARHVFETLGVKVREVNVDDAEGVAKVESGAIDATILIGAKPSPLLAKVSGDSGMKLIALPYARGLEAETYPAMLTHDDYPELIAEGEQLDTVSVCAVLVSFNWSKQHDRTKKLDRFVARFFDNFDTLFESPRHPKWQHVNFAAVLETWPRSPRAQAWIDRAKKTVATDASARKRFETFLAQADTGGGAASEEERAKLFRAFVEWSKQQQSQQSN